MSRHSGVPSHLKIIGPAATGLLLLFLGLASHAAWGASARNEAAGDAPAGVSDAWLSEAQAHVAALEYHVTWQDAPSLHGQPASWHAPNREQGFRTFFTDQAIRMVPRVISGERPHWDLSLELARYGRGGAALALPGGQVSTSGGRIQIDRGTVIEWYVNEPRGLKQGFTLAAPPDEIVLAADDPLPRVAGAVNNSEDQSVHLDLRLTGNLLARPAEDGRLVDLLAPGGARVLRYSDLLVVDDAGRELPASMEILTTPEVAFLRLSFDDSSAIYPVMVDPLMTSPAWTAESDQISAWLGFASASAGDVNGDGYSDVIAGAPRYDVGSADEGAAFVWYGSPSGLAATPSWTIEGQQAGAEMGTSVGSAGDVNGDGFSDVIVGAHRMDNGQSNEGMVFVFHGSASGLIGGPVAGTADADWSAESNQDSAMLGSFVDSAGDVNGDGYSDVIAAAYRMDGGQSDEGMAFVFHGSASGLTGGPSATAADADWSVESDQATARLGQGQAASGAGDVNGDGYSDVIVGAPLYDNVETNEGAVFLFNGSASGLAGAPAATLADASWTMESNQAFANLGISGGAAGDLNGDGYADIVVGAHVFDEGQDGEGKVFVFHGSATGPAGAPAATPADADWSVQGDQAGAHLGQAMGTAGDVDGDGFSDLIVGAPLYDNMETDEGSVFLYRGSASGLPGGPAATPADADWSFESDVISAQLGSSAGAAGDVNGDGYGDLLVGAYVYGNGEAQEGRVFAFMGSGSVPAGGPAGTLADADWSWEPDQSGALLGYGMASAGDINGDGYDDIAVGAYGFDNGETDEGMVFIFVGFSTGIVPFPWWTFESDIENAYFGFGVDISGDVNGDGISDLLVGASGYSNGEADEGGAFLFLSPHRNAPTFNLADADWSVEGDQASAKLGITLDSGGDFNGDGFADIAIGAFQYTNGQTNEGAVGVFYGSSTGPGGGPAASLSDAQWIVESDLAGANLTYWDGISSGDLDGDGLSDLLVGCGDCNSPHAGGSVFGFRGSASGLSGGPAATPADADWSVGADQNNAGFGTSVSADGDVNGDGFDDLLAGAPSYDGVQSNAGAVFLFPGSAAGLTATTTAEAFWGVESDQYPAMLHGARMVGDVNGDGIDDLIVGAHSYTNGQSQEGLVMLFLGSPAGPRGGPRALPADADWRIESDVAGGRLGWPSFDKGDVNGDGFSDLILAAPQYTNGQVDEGRIALFYGNGSPGAALRPRQRLTSYPADISRLGSTGTPDSFRVAMTGRSPAGRSLVKLQWEVKPHGVPFDGTGMGESAFWWDTGTTGVALSELVTGLDSATLHHWRARLLHHPAGDSTQPASRWFTRRAGGWTAPALRTASGTTDLSLTVSDSPDPILSGGVLTYTIDVLSAGPDPTTVTLFQDLPASAGFVSASSSQGTCQKSGSQVICLLGSLSSGGAIQVQVQVTSPPAAGTLSSEISLVSTGIDPTPSDNATVEDTLVHEPALGNRIWEDLDGDGIQGAGEPGLEGVLVALYDGAGNLLNATSSDPNGAYGFQGLVLGGDYFLWVGAPSGYTFTTVDAGADDSVDSDVDPLLFTTPLISLLEGDDPLRWDAGLYASCIAPDEPIYIYNMTLTTDGNSYPVLHFQDANQTSQVTGYNVRRTSDASIPRSSWPQVATDVIDMDEATPNKQWVDISGDVSPTGIWFYIVSAFNDRCSAEGPLE